MNFNFYENLSISSKMKYDAMLDTNFVLLRCDEWPFVEVDENNSESMSLSWILSIQPTLEMFGLDPKSYPQGSLSANRHYYEALRNYLGGEFPNVPEFNNLRKSLLNLIQLRRDDSSPNRSYLFGSYYKILKAFGSRDQAFYRHVDISPRHSATAIWILCQESNINLSESLENSICAFLTYIENYISKNKDWNRDNYKHLTLSGIIGTLSLIISKFPSFTKIKRVKELKLRCENLIFGHDCIKQTLDGLYEWKLPSRNEAKLATYEYYLNAFVLTLVPSLMESPKGQSIIRGMISNRIESDCGFGIPIHKLANYLREEDKKPDFGSTSSVLYLIWYCLENEIGNDEWLNYCFDNFDWLLESCLNTYNKPEYYILPHSENNTKILLMPRLMFDKARELVLKQYINDLKKYIFLQMDDKQGKLRNMFKKPQTPLGFEHVNKIINSWQISKYWQNQRNWEFKENWSKVGEFTGGLISGFLKSTSSA